MKKINLKFTPVILFVWLAVGCGFFSRPPSDKTMEERFRSNEADFNKLITMYKEDKLFELTPEAAYVEPANGNDRGVKTELPPPRMEEYRRLLRQVNAGHVIGTGRKVVLYVFEGNVGWLESDYQSKSYVYAEKPPSSIVVSLDRKNDLPDNDYLIDAYKKIADKWYLHFSGGKDLGWF